MSRRPVVEFRTLRGPTKTQDALRKRAAGEAALIVVKALDGATAGRDAEFVMLVERLLVRTMATRMARDTGVARAQGVLAGAAADVSPAFTPASPAASPAALALFKEPA